MLDTKGALTMCLRIIRRAALQGCIQGISWFCIMACVAAAERPPSSVLHITDGGSVAGELRGSDDPKVLRWRSPSFAQPLEFPFRAAKAVYYATPGPQPK